MATSKQDLERWFQDGINQKATHMIIMCDTFDWDDYPVYITDEQDVKEEVKKRENNNMQKLMEVYDLRKPMREQVYADTLQFNY